MLRKVTYILALNKAPIVRHNFHSWTAQNISKFSEAIIIVSLNNKRHDKNHNLKLFLFCNDNFEKSENKKRV